MKKLILIGLLALFPSIASAQCTGIFQPNTFCGNNSGSPQPPFAVPASSAITGPGSSIAGDLAVWNNTSGSLLIALTPSALTAVNDTNITAVLGGSASTSLVHAASITFGWAGTLAAARLNSNVVQAITNDTNVTGSITAQNLTLGWTGTLAAARLNANVVQAFTNDTNVTASVAAQNATLGWTGTLSVARGGTGSGTAPAAIIALMPTPVRAGDIVYWNGSNWVTLTGNNAGTQFLQENSSGVPSWVTVTGSGTVTSATIASGIGIVVSGTCTITTVGTCTVAIALPKFTNSLGADVLLNNTANYFDGPSVAQGTSGTWFANGTVSLLDVAGAANISCKLWDGTTVISSISATTAGPNFVMPGSLSGFLTSPAANIRISCKDATSTTGKILFNNSGNSKDSTLSVIQIQ